MDCICMLVNMCGSTISTRARVPARSSGIIASPPVSVSRRRHSVSHVFVLQQRQRASHRVRPRCSAHFIGAVSKKLCPQLPQLAACVVRRARAGLLANSGCFVSKCVLWCFVVFCGCFVVFCGCVFCGVLRVFYSISTKHTKHPKNIEKHWKIQKTHNTLVYCGSFPRAQNFDCIAQSTFHKTSAKHLQNTAKHRKTVTKRGL